MSALSRGGALAGKLGGASGDLDAAVCSERASPARLASVSRSLTSPSTLNPAERRRRRLSLLGVAAVPPSVVPEAAGEALGRSATSGRGHHTASEPNDSGSGALASASGSDNSSSKGDRLKGRASPSCSPSSSGTLGSDVAASGDGGSLGSGSGGCASTPGAHSEGGGALSSGDSGVRSSGGAAGTEAADEVSRSSASFAVMRSTDSLEGMALRQALPL